MKQLFREKNTKPKRTPFEDLDLSSDDAGSDSSYSNQYARSSNPFDNLDADITGNNNDHFDVYDFRDYLIGSEDSRRQARTRRNIKKALLGLAVICVALCFPQILGNGNDVPSSPPEVNIPITLQTEPIETEPIETAAPVIQPTPEFQARRSYFASRLTSEEQLVYDQIAAGIARMDESIGPLYLDSLDSLTCIIEAIRLDNAEFFWFDGGYSTSYFDHDNHIELTIIPNYAFSAAEAKQYAQFIEKKVQPLLDQLSELPDYDKVKGVYEYLIDNTIYDYAYMGRTMYELFHDGRAVCEGYARSAQYLLNRLGVETLYVTGFAGPLDRRAEWEGHAWNIVKIDGIYYQLDVTWGDPLHEDGTQSKNFNYLNVTDSEMARRHEANAPELYPVCDQILHNYFYIEGRYLPEFDTDILKSWMHDSVPYGTPLEFKCADEHLYRQVCSWLQDQGGFHELIVDIIGPDTGYSYSYSFRDDMYIITLSLN